jgi:MoaA/NifB/PqqE/SkfB family radical SAM enzyme
MQFLNLKRKLNSGRTNNMKQISRAEFAIRHLITFAPYLTLAKVVNLMLNIAELKLQITRPRSLPPYLKVETTPLCQMACPGCAHGERESKQALSRGKVQLRLEEFKTIIDPVCRAVIGVSLSFRGEPLLGKDLIPIIEHAHSKNIAVSFPSNFSVSLPDEKITQLVKSGVDTIYVSLDGASEETYRQYRLGGSFQRVLRNVEAIARAKAKLRLSRPRLIWKFVVFEHNRHEIPSVATQYRRLGFDAFEFVEDESNPAKSQARSRNNAELVAHRKGCWWAWHTATVRADGIVAPCCKSNKDFGLGDARIEPLRDIWRGRTFANLRRGFKSMRASELHPICARCLGVAESASDGARAAPTPTAINAG